MGEPLNKTSNPEVDLLVTSQPAQSASLYPIKLGSDIDFVKISAWSLVADTYLRTRLAHFSKCLVGQDMYRAKLGAAKQMSGLVTVATYCNEPTICMYRCFSSWLSNSVLLSQCCS
jgi:hypothetical protein